LIVAEIPCAELITLRPVRYCIIGFLLLALMYVLLIGTT
jgi:hypothetical protein